MFCCVFPIEILLTVTFNRDSELFSYPAKAEILIEGTKKRTKGNSCTNMYMTWNINFRRFKGQSHSVSIAVTL